MSYVPTYQSSQDNYQPNASQSQMRDSLEQHILNGDANVRQRDAFDPNLAALKQSHRPKSRAINENPYNVWTDTRQRGFKPIIFEPNGDFQSLRDSAKLSEHGAKQRAIGAGDHVSNKKYYIPGYTGYVRGIQHVSGRTFGQATRRALDTDYRENVCTSPIPSAPQNNRKIEHMEPRDTFVSNTFAGKQYHLPGYTGHVPRVRQTFARTFGSSTSSELYTQSLQHPRAAPRELEGFANTMRPRDNLIIDSAPLPGPQGIKEPPKMLVPKHLQHLQFFSM